MSISAHRSLSPYPREMAPGMIVFATAFPTPTMRVTTATRQQAWGDRDHDGVPNRYDGDKDGDGVPNQWDREPGNPYR